MLKLKRRSLVALFLLQACCLCAPRLAAKDKREFLDPKEAGKDFQVQGEYSGKVLIEGKEAKCGVQVVARGNGNFIAHAYPGGLPGDGWNKKQDKRSPEAKGKTVDGVTTFDNLLGKARIQDGTMTITDASGKELGRLKKTIRKSPTLGRKPSPGAVVLFDGTSAEKFDGGQMTDDGYLLRNTRTKQKFQSVLLHLEFRTPFRAFDRGQNRGNSGAYLQSRYEVQILDSFGLEGKHNEAGGIYSVSDPFVNMCFPPLSWQTYDVEYTAAKFDANGKKVENAKMTVWHNGVLIHKDQSIPKWTTAAPEARESPEPGPLFLQGHGSTVTYRNIWVLERK